MNIIDNKMAVEVEHWIDLKLPELLKDFFRILKVPSVADMEIEKQEYLPFGQGCQKVLEEMLLIGENYGFSTRNYENYVGRISYGEKAVSIGIWTHLDVVESGEGWQYQPYEPIEKAGYIIARGAQDNKSSAVMGLYVLRYLKEHGLKLNYNVSLYCGTCEEKGMYDLDYFTEHYETPLLSLVPDSGFPVCQGERGSFNGKLTSHRRLSEEIKELETSRGLYMVPEWARITLLSTKERRERTEMPPPGITVRAEGECLEIYSQGVSSHAINPDRGVHAMKQLLGFLRKRDLLEAEDWEILTFAEKMNEDSSGKALSVYCEDEISGPIILTQTESWIEEGHLVMNFISKYPVTMGEKNFEKAAKDAAESEGYSMEMTRMTKPFYHRNGHTAMKILCDTYNSVEGQNDQPFIMSGGTYARKLPNAFAFGTNLPLPARPEELFLPGHGSFHQPDESVSVLRIKKALKIYILSILQLNEIDEKQLKGE